MYWYLFQWWYTTTILKQPISLCLQQSGARKPLKNRAVHKACIARCAATFCPKKAPTFQTWNTTFQQQLLLFSYQQLCTVMKWRCKFKKRSGTGKLVIMHWLFGFRFSEVLKFKSIWLSLSYLLHIKFEKPTLLCKHFSPRSPRFVLNPMEPCQRCRPRCVSCWMQAMRFSKEKLVMLESSPGTWGGGEIQRVLQTVSTIPAHLEWL